MIWLYIALAGIGIAFNLILWVVGEAAQPGERSKTTFWGCVFLFIPFSVLLAPLFEFLISPWRKS